MKALKETRPLTSDEIIRRSQQFLDQKVKQKEPGQVSAVEELVEGNHLAEAEFIDGSNISLEEGSSAAAAQASTPQVEARHGWRNRIRGLVSRSPYNEKEAEKITKKFALRLNTKPVKVFHLDGDHLIMGRSTDCHITIEDMNVSRRHAELLLTSQGYQIQDLGSKNGTFVNGKLVNSFSPLSPGDEVMLGSTTSFFFEQE